MLCATSPASRSPYKFRAATESLSFRIVINASRRRCGVFLRFRCHLRNYDLLTSLLPITNTRRRAYKQQSCLAGFLFGPPSDAASCDVRSPSSNKRETRMMLSDIKTRNVCCTADYTVTPSLAWDAWELAVKPATYSLCHFILFVSLSLSKYSSLATNRCGVEKINGYG